MEQELTDSYLTSRGWELSSHRTWRWRGSAREAIPWWRRGEWIYPQHLALELERHGWVKILETMP